MAGLISFLHIVSLVTVRDLRIDTLLSAPSFTSQLLFSKTIEIEHGGEIIRLIVQKKNGTKSIDQLR